jgi:hypothetical protein
LPSQKSNLAYSKFFNPKWLNNHHFANKLLFLESKTNKPTTSPKRINHYTSLEELSNNLKDNFLWIISLL